jgi:hypothetical protein
MTNKKPLNEWRRYQTEPTTHEEVEDWFTNGAPTKEGGRVEMFNLALVTGVISGVIVLDCDNDKAVEYAKRNGIASPISVKTTRGRHFYFAHPGHGLRFANKVGGTSKDWPELNGLDLRGDGGYVVMPPSVKLDPGGTVVHSYEWEIGVGLALDDVTDFIWQGRPTEVEAPDEGGEFSFNTLSLADYRVYNPDERMPIHEQIAQRVAHLGRKLRDGDGRNNWLVRLAGQKVRQGVLGDDLVAVCRAFMGEFFDSPLPIGEVTSVIRSAQEMDKRNYPEDYAEDGSRRKKEVEERKNTRFVPIYADAVDRLLAEMKDEVYWSDPILPTGTITQVAGYNGHGKSYFVTAMLSALAAGQEWFGPYQLGRPAKIFYMDYDNPRRTVLRRLREFNDMFGSTQQNLGVWSPALIAPEDGGEMNLMEESGFAMLGEWMRVVQPDIVVIDTIRNAFRGLEEASASEWAKVNLVARTIRNRIGASVIMVHHRNKPGEAGLGREAGSTAQLTDIDTQVFVTQVFREKHEAKQKAGLLDGDHEVYDAKGVAHTPWGYLERMAGQDARVSMVSQISFGKVRQQTELHETHYIGWCESLLDGKKFIVSTKSRKQRALRMATAQGMTPLEIAVELKVPVAEVRRWLGVDLLGASHANHAA